MCRAALARQPSPPQSKGRILIIDDEPYNCLALQTMLKGLKVPLGQVDLATSGKMALQMILTSLATDHTGTEDEDPLKRMGSFKPSEAVTQAIDLLISKKRQIGDLTPSDLGL